MALKVINEISLRLKFLLRKNKFLAPVLHRLLCSALIQPLKCKYAMNQGVAQIRGAILYYF